MVPDTRPQRGGVASENSALKFPSPPRASYWTTGQIHNRKTQHSTHIIPPDPPLHSQDIVGSPLPTGARGRRQAALAEEWLAYNEDLGEVAAVCVRVGGWGAVPRKTHGTTPTLWGTLCLGHGNSPWVGRGEGCGGFPRPSVLNDAVGHSLSFFPLSHLPPRCARTWTSW